MIDMSTVERACNVNPPGFRTFGFSWPLLTAFFAFSQILTNQRFNAILGDPDTYWHIAAGQWILANKAVPHVDPFSHSMPGVPWTAHEWLSEVVLASVQALADWTGLVVLVALLFAGTLAYLLRFLLGRMEPIHALLLTALAAGMLMGHLLARPHVLVWPLLAVWVGTLVDAGERRSDPPWGALILMVLWANLHGSFVLGLGLSGVLALDAVLSQAAECRRKAAVRWACFVGLAVFAAMITPSGWWGLWYPVQVSGMDLALKVISEWRSPDFQKLQTLEVWLMLVLAAACSGRMRLPLLRLILMLGLVHLALKHHRHMSVLGLVSPFLIATPFAAVWHKTKGAMPDAESLDRIFSAFALPARRGAIAVAVVLAAVVIGAVLQTGRFSPAAASSPEAAVDAAIRVGASGPVLNSYNFGGYLIYRGIPVFIDGRADMYGDELLKRYIDAVGLADTAALEKLLADYRIGWTLLGTGTPAVALLDHLPGWRRVHADGVAVAHVRDSVGAVQ
ncbi:hypothetical protein GPA22_04890 [Aromatoleum toluvorans]|uniref:Dolichyl-phosphate-mannose-protein mannosyltransferase n=1 Tax=Aromatoleum toluvorans TaxID=92002 RepID=A0ABX1PWQ1_9RHOO|nr:hypothetical protein [Aromatoleum toluvorans]NMG43065.1 hypothetical protein [Aromatoleum toluvorans]